MQKIFKNWKHGFDFFFSPNWSGWTKLDYLKEEFEFSSKTIWLTRYFISVPVIFAPFIIVFFMINSILVNAQNGINSTANAKTVIIIGLLFSLVIYPSLMFALYSRYGVIRKRNDS